jgi:hypothetical protein
MKSELGKHPARLLLVMAASVVAGAAPASGQSIFKPQGSQGPLSPRVPQLQAQPTFEVICRGGALRLEKQGARLGLFFAQSPVLPGADGALLPEGTCSPSARLFSGTEPPGIEFGAAAEYETYRREVAESDRRFRFVVSAAPGMFIARDHRSWKIPTPPTLTAIVSPATPIAGRAPSAPSAEKPQQKGVEILCRGGRDLRVDRLSAPAGAPGAVTMGVYFLPPKVPAGTLGKGLPPGTCSFRGNHLFGPGDPVGIQFETAANARGKPMLSGSVGSSATAAERFPDAETIPLYLKDPAHYWRFIAVNTHRGFFHTTEHQHWKLGTERLAGGEAVGAGRPAADSGAVKQAAQTERGVSANVTQGDIDKGVPGPPPGQAASRPAEKVDPNLQQLAAAAPAGLSGLDDRAIIVVGGRQTTIGQLRQEMAAAGGVGTTTTGVLDDVLAADDRAIIVVGGREMPAASVKQEIQREMTLRSRTPPHPATATSELNQAAYRNPMNRVARNQEAAWKSTVVTPTARGAKFQFVWEATRTPHAGGAFHESELPVVEVGLEKPQVAPNGHVAFVHVSARATAGLYGGHPIPNDSSTWGQRLVVWAEIDGPLTPNTRYHYLVRLPAASGPQFEYGTFATLDGFVPADNRIATAPAIGTPQFRRETQLQTPAGGRAGIADGASQRETLVGVAPHNRGAVFSHQGPPATAYHRMRVQVSDRPPSFDASGRLTFDRSIADVGASGSTARVKVYSPYESHVEQYSVTCNVDGLAAGGRFYYIVTLTRLDDGAFHQERGTFTTASREE